MIRRIVTLLLSTAVLLGLVGVLGATGASAAPAPKLRLAASTVTVYGPKVNPIGDGDCNNIHVFSECGTVVVTTTIKGFKAYGGIDTCHSYETCGADHHQGLYDQFGSASGGSAKLVMVYRCGNSGPVHVLRTTLRQQIVWQGVASNVNADTRVDSDTAKLTSVYLFPSPGSYSPCAFGQTRILGGVVYHFVFTLTGAGGVPTQSWYKVGYYAVPLPA